MYCPVNPQDFKLLYLLEVQSTQVFKISAWLVSNTSNVLLFCSSFVINSSVWNVKKKNRFNLLSACLHSNRYCFLLQFSSDSLTFLPIFSMLKGHST